MTWSWLVNKTYSHQAEGKKLMMIWWSNMRMTWSNMRMIIRTCSSQAREKKGCASHEDWEGPESPDVEGRRAGKIWFLKLVKYICGNEKHRHSHSYNVYYVYRLNNKNITWSSTREGRWAKAEGPSLLSIGSMKKVVFMWFHLIWRK